MKIGIIGGTGFYELFENARMFIHHNKYGTSSEIYQKEISGKVVYFLPRHGPRHNIIVSRINYRANIWAFKELGVTRIIATNSVGAINPEMHPGDIVIPNDFIDFTRRFPRSLYDNETVAIHVNMIPPYCPEIRNLLIKVSKEMYPEIATYGSAVILVHEGLRFETPAELKLYKNWGADIVGMTTIPEVVFAREANICYAQICIPTNYATGNEEIKASEFKQIFKKGILNVKKIIFKTISLLPEERKCLCKDAVKNGILKRE